MATHCDKLQHTVALYVAIARETSWWGGVEGKRDKYGVRVTKRERQCVYVCARERE